MKVKSNRKLLAIDFGYMKVGLAACDLRDGVVFGKGIIKNYGSLEKLFVLLGALCVKENITDIVFGLPMGNASQDTEKSLKLRGIGEKLADCLKVPVHFFDESYSTFNAQKLLNEIPGKSGEAVDDDELAAVVILEGYLAQMKPL